MRYQVVPSEWRLTPWVLRMMGYRKYRRLMAVVRPFMPDPLDWYEYSDAL